jgi:hypothetical protein
MDFARAACREITRDRRMAWHLLWLGPKARSRKYGIRAEL